MKTRIEKQYGQDNYLVLHFVLFLMFNNGRLPFLIFNFGGGRNN